MDLLQGLNEAQIKAVTTGDGPVLVLAGPGSGKTRVLTHRVAYLIAQRGVSPDRLMAVTFTNKAAREMKDRLLHLVGDRLTQITLGTFHAICARLLHREIHRLGFKRDFVIYDEDDTRTAVKQVLKDLDLDEQRFAPGALAATISRAKSQLIGAEEFSHKANSYWEEVVGRVYARYQEVLAANQALDFDDLLMMVVRIFREWPEALQRYQERYQHILVDEFQDTNHAQYEIVKLLSGKHRNVFCVGDVDQSIYSWRGADYRNVLNFEHDFPDARLFLLEQNYRSSQNILGVAQAVIRANQQRQEKRLWTENAPGLPITVYEAYNEEEEAGFVVNEMARLIAQDHHQPGDLAVMYRTNAQSRALEDALVRANMPYRLVGATRFYERREVKDVLAYLRLVHNPLDTVSLRRVINVPPRGIGAKSLTQLEKAAAEKGVGWYEVLKEIKEDAGRKGNWFDTRTRKAFSDFSTVLTDLLAGRDRSVMELLDYVVERTGYRRFIQDGTTEGEERWQNVMELRNVAAEYGGLAPEAALTTFLEEVALVSDVDNYDASANAPTLLTLHSAKGLEFPVVFIVGLEEGLLPHSRSFADPAACEEERRLCYVGITRAKERLYLVHAFRRTLYGNSLPSVPSRFLADVPPHLVQGRQVETPVQRAATWGRAAFDLPEAGRSARLESAPVALDKPTFAPGEKVRHAQFGEGVVISSVIKGDDEEVTVAFIGLKPKRLLASIAQLQRVWEVDDGNGELA